MLRCPSHDSTAIDAWRAQIQTPHAAEKVQQLFLRTPLSTAFREVAQIPAMGAWMQAGNIDALLGVKCDEEIIEYLATIPAAWSYFVGGAAMLHKIDRHTIEMVQLRCPANCAQDRTTLDSMMADGTIFSAFEATTRQEIWQRLLLFTRRVPSLYAFFEDLKYLRDLAGEVVRFVKPLRKQTIRQACRAAFALPLARFDRAYRQLWIGVMRELHSLEPQTGRMEDHERRETQARDLKVEYDVARHVQELGFQSSQLEELVTEHPDEKIARRMLLQARRPSEYTYPADVIESCVTQMVAIFRRAQPNSKTDQIPPVLIVDGDGEYDDDRRCGRPHTLASRDCHDAISFDNFHMADSRDVGGLSAFYIRRDVYISFFGSLRSGSDPEPDADVDQCPSSDVAVNDQVQTSVDEIVNVIDRELGQQLLDRRELCSSTSTLEAPENGHASAQVRDIDMEKASSYIVRAPRLLTILTCLLTLQ